MRTSAGRRAPRLGVLMVAVVLLAAVACSSSPAVSDPGTTTAATPSVELLDFEAPLLDGGTFRGQDLAGKDVAFWFWAPW